MSGIKNIYIYNRESLNVMYMPELAEIILL